MTRALATTDQATGVPPAGTSRSRVVKPGRLAVSEFAADRAGAASPFGDDLRFPLPVEVLTYVHPEPDTDEPAAH
ncbi:MAG TPA: hypothetical protein VJT31_40880 [Rugosimonospora sp.]|nr:hypothetical protein [Rugosimonospora sp.]